MTYSGKNLNCKKEMGVLPELLESLLHFLVKLSFDSIDDLHLLNKQLI